MMCELQRIASHLVWLGTHALDLGAMTVFFYCFREREKIMNLIEAASGGRLTPSYFPRGRTDDGSARRFERRVQQFQNDLPNALDEFGKLVTGNRIFQKTHPGRWLHLRRGRDLTGVYRDRACAAVAWRWT
jgi:NADH-quinone oxidoreductase subunit D